MTPEQHKEIEAYNERRNAILIKGNLNEVEALLAENSGMKPSSREVTEIMLHKCRTAVLKLPIELRKASKQWLAERGMKSLDDGDL